MNNDNGGFLHIESNIFSANPPSDCYSPDGYYETYDAHYKVNASGAMNFGNAGVEDTKAGPTRKRSSRRNSRRLRPSSGSIEEDESPALHTAHSDFPDSYDHSGAYTNDSWGSSEGRSPKRHANDMLGDIDMNMLGLDMLGSPVHENFDHKAFYSPTHPKHPSMDGKGGDMFADTLSSFNFQIPQNLTVPIDLNESNNSAIEDIGHGGWSKAFNQQPFSPYKDDPINGEFFGDMGSWRPPVHSISPALLNAKPKPANIVIPDYNSSMNHPTPMSTSTPTTAMYSNVKEYQSRYPLSAHLKNATPNATVLFPKAKRRNTKTPSTVLPTPSSPEKFAMSDLIREHESLKKHVSESKVARQKEEIESNKMMETLNFLMDANGMASPFSAK